MVEKYNTSLILKICDTRSTGKVQWMGNLPEMAESEPAGSP
jgi:hypothetical protein